MNNICYNKKVFLYMDTFQQDIEHFQHTLFSNNSINDIKKNYYQLIKKYHPDITNEENKLLYQEYTKKIINIYKNFLNESNADEVFFQKESYSENINDSFFYSLLMNIARNEYILYKKNAIRKRWPKNPEQKKYLRNAIRCYEIVIYGCKNSKITKAAIIQLEWIKPLYNIQE